MPIRLPWGETVEQLADGDITLWFESGAADNWNAALLTYADGENRSPAFGVKSTQKQKPVHKPYKTKAAARR